MEDVLDYEHEQHLEKPLAALFNWSEFVFYTLQIGFLIINTAAIPEWIRQVFYAYRICSFIVLISSIIVAVKVLFTPVLLHLGFLDKRLKKAIVVGWLGQMLIVAYTPFVLAATMLLGYTTNDLIKYVAYLVIPFLIGIGCLLYGFTQLSRLKLTLTTPIVFRRELNSIKFRLLLPIILVVVSGAAGYLIKT